LALVAPRDRRNDFPIYGIGILPASALTFSISDTRCFGFSSLMIPSPIALGIQNRAYSLAIQQVGRSPIVAFDEFFLNVSPIAVFAGFGQLDS
jgi:hypothetical protein